MGDGGLLRPDGGGVSEKMIGSAPLPASAGEPRLISVQNMWDDRYSFIDRQHGSAKFRVDFAYWKGLSINRALSTTSPSSWRAVPSTPTRAKYIMYISPVVRARLSGDFKEAHSHQVPITQTSAEDFVTFMRAVAPGREPVTDADVQTLFGLADVYDVEFLRRDCEKHLLGTKGIEAKDKLLLVQSLNKTDLITRLVGSMSQADLEQIKDDDRQDELSEEVKDQLRERQNLGF